VFHWKALDEAFQVFWTQALAAAVQVHDFHKVTVRPACSRARGLRQVERPNLADDYPKRLLEDPTLVPFKRLESSR
jgi:hypothetical protein